MNKMKKYSVLTLVLSGFSFLGLIISHLALTDIYHGGENLSFEWAVLKISAVVFLTLIIFTIFTLKKALKVRL